MNKMLSLHQSFHFHAGQWLQLGRLKREAAEIRKYAEYEDMTIVGEYSDEGFSGKNILGRLDFHRMLNDIQENKDDISYVLSQPLIISIRLSR